MILEIIDGIRHRTSENEADRRILAGREKDPVEASKLILGPDFTEKDGNEKRPYFERSAVVTEPWIDPFMTALHNLTGHKWFPEPDVPIDLLPAWAEYGRLPAHTHWVTKAELITGAVYIDGYLQSGDWNGKTAEERAGPTFLSYCNKDFGVEWTPAEYKESQNGACSRNRYYASGHRRILPHGSRPDRQSEFHWRNYQTGRGLREHWFFASMFILWLKHGASKAQHEVIKASCILQEGMTGGHKPWAEYTWYCEATEELLALGLKADCNWNGDKKCVVVSSKLFKSLGANNVDT